MVMFLCFIISFQVGVALDGDNGGDDGGDEGDDNNGHDMAWHGDDNEDLYSLMRVIQPFNQQSACRSLSINWFALLKGCLENSQVSGDDPTTISIFSSDPTKVINRFNRSFVFFFTHRFQSFTVSMNSNANTTTNNCR